MKVGAIIAGYQKCGTTALHTFLSQHPKVVGSVPKELDFFSFEKNYNKGEAFYHSHFRKPNFLRRKGVLYLESSPSYVSGHEVRKTAKRLYRYNPDVKVLVLVRDPSFRAYSAWNMYRDRYFNGNKDWWINWKKERTGKDPIVQRRTEDEYASFYLYLEKELEAIRSGVEIEARILEPHGMYHRGIEVFKEVFQNNLLVIKNEDLLLETPFILSKVQSFLGLADFDWSQFEGKVVFEGGYKKSKDLPEEGFHLLSNYYRDSNEMLNALTGISYF